jgi:hypothetical protein
LLPASPFFSAVEHTAVEIKLETFVVKKSDRGFPPSLDYFNELSFLQSVSISVNGHPLWIPRSSYADLFDPGETTISYEKGEFVLSIVGADASDAYQVRIGFDSERVLQRTVYSLEGSGEKPTEERKGAISRALLRKLIT